ncbi:MAG: heat-inducible transcriptional repressor HrcA [Lachnospiraceae bacterium]|nr:heat-inducible transcriptional repressor HrcA [Lachnospiraceae bacterium]
MELDERKRKILQAIIKTYLETGEPVGSRTISKMEGLNLSSATIRNEMADLEEMGYILQPHTSAGRIPSDAGYRLYVDQMMAEKALEREEHALTVKDEEHEKLLAKVDRLETLLQQVAKVLAYNTNYATMVTGPDYKNTNVKFVQLSQVDDEQLLAVIVVGSNVIKNKMIDVEERIPNEELLKLNVLLNTFLTGVSVKEIDLELVQTMKQQAGVYADILEHIFDGIIDAVRSATETEVYTSGATNILKYPELGDINRAGELLEVLEEKKALNHLIADENEDGTTNQYGIQVYIGDETPVETLNDCSIVTATYELEEGVRGKIGIIGPKRMDYDKVVTTLRNLTDELDTIFKNKKT